jgi:prepilin signal peptidase PulO-like enzyme (type II secretory pathway)
MTFEWIIPLLLGWIAGWIVNYLSDVLPATRQLSQPACLQCGSSFSLKDYLLFRRCSNGHSRSLRTWIVQIVMTAFSIYIFTQPPAKFGFGAGMVLLLYFGVVFTIDMEHRLILHPTSFAGSVLALILGTVSHGLVPTLLGGLGGLIIMLLFYYFGVLFARLRARRMQVQGLETDDEDALGQGDVILVTILGFLVGWPLIWFMIIISILLGGIVSFLLVVGLLITRRYNTNALMIFIPFGPYFIFGALLIVYFPNFLSAFLSG